MKINKYETSEKVFEGAETFLYRATNKESSQTVILKFAKTESALARLKNEYDILNNLKFENIPQVVDFYPHAEKPFIALTDIPGLPLIDFVDSIKNYPMKRICEIFINLTKVLNQIHSKNIIHKDIKPSNILYQKENDFVSIIDFGISSQFDFKLRDQRNIKFLEGTLRYIAPEQTGRINRSIDQRSDLYSLGITFYQLLTGLPPFQSEDSIELIHNHISRIPNRILHISNSLNEIIFKLIAKNPEDRYQSTYGLIHDLTRVKQGETNFIIAQKDFSERLQLSESLYGRDNEIKILSSILENTNVNAEKANYLIIKGEPGQGKSILIDELLNSTIQKGGYFLRGKHDQIKENIPYFSISQILKKYTEFVLSEKLEIQEKIKSKLLSDLGDNAGLPIILAPEMELLLGKHPVPETLEGSEGQNRFNSILILLLKSMAITRSPLVIVIDDLQWADTATFQLLTKILNENSIPGLFLILSYRNKEEQNSEYFLNFLEYLNEIDSIKQIELKNLEKLDISNLLKDTIGENASNFDKLVEFLYDTTQGNPFFVKQLLKELYFNKALSFDFVSEKWKFDYSVIQKITMGDTILDFMKIKLSSIPEKTKTFLKIASFEGLEFSKNSVSNVGNFSEEEVKNILKEISIAGIVYPAETGLADSNYYFLHDRILQAAYLLNSQEEIKLYNYKFGNYYKENFADSRVFDICNFYNKSFELILSETEILDLIQFHYKAILLSKNNIAYENGLNYSKTALSYLSKISNPPKELSFSIEEEYGWFLFATGDFEEGEKVYLRLIEICPDLKSYVRLNNVRIGSLASRARIFDSVNLGLEVLKKLGLTIPDSEEERGALFFSEYGKILHYLETHSVNDLLTLSKMDNEIQILIQQILSRLLIPAILSAQITLLGVLTCISITKVIEFGSIDLVAYAYALFAVTIISIKQDYKTGIEFGEIAIIASQLNNNKALMGGVFNTVGCITNHLKYPAVDNERLFLKSSKFCEESGNIFENVLSQGNSLWNKFYRGENLNEILIYCNNYQNVCKKYFVWDAMINIYYPTMGIVNYLTGKQSEGNLLYYDGRSELEHVDIVEKLGSKSPLAQFYGILITKSFLFGKYSEILKTGELLEKNTAAPTVFHDICPNFYRCVAYILILDTLSGEEKSIYQNKIEKLKNDFKVYSELNPKNFLHMYLLILAVESSKSSNHWNAVNYFEQSIQSALENGYIQNAAISYELAGNFYKENNLIKIAETFYFESYKLFRTWGAETKLKSIESKYPSFKLQKNSTLYLTQQPTLSTSKTTADFQMDYLSTIKAADIILREVKTDSLIQKIIQVILENSGATEATLIIKKDNVFMVHTFGKVSDKVTIEFINQPIEYYENICLAIVNYVTISKSSVILANAMTQNDYNTNQYIQRKRVQSLLCKPILHKGDVIGAIYLENNFIFGAFSRERSEIINLISTLAGISIENAILYEELDNKVKNRTKELNAANTKLIETNTLLENTLNDLKVTQDQLIISEKMVFLGKLIAGIAHEVNTPLGAIVASNQVILDLISEDSLDLLGSYSEFDEKQKQAWRILYETAKNSSIFFDTTTARKNKKDLAKYLEQKEIQISNYTLDTLCELGINVENIDTIIPYLSLVNFEIVLENALNIITILNSGKIIKNAAEKASKVIIALKNYAHEDQLEIRKMVDIRYQIEMCLVLYQNKIKRGMEIITEFAENSKLVGFTDKLNQLWINLINNALYAVNFEGKLTIKSFIQDKYLGVSFTDNGTGIPKEIQNKIFKPFFTTKQAEDGSGLGLDICKKIVDAHNGKIEFFSEPGNTCFTIYLDRFLEQ